MSLLIAALLASSLQASPNNLDISDVYEPGMAQEPEVVGALVLHDVRSYLAYQARVAGRARETAAGRAYYAPAGKAPMPSWAELARLIELAVPDAAQKVRAQILLLEGPNGPTWQASLTLAPGALGRLATVRDSTLGLLQEEEAGWRWRAFGVSLALSETRDGTLVIGPQRGLVKQALALPPLSPAMQEATRDAPMVVFLSDKSVLLRALAGTSGGVFAHVATWALSFAWDDDRSVRMRFLAEAPILGALGPLAARGDAQAPQRWFGDVDALWSLSVPPGLMQALVPVAGTIVEKADVPHGDRLMEILQSFTGGIEVVGFSNPGDWALSLRFRDEAAARGAVVALGRVWQASLRREKSHVLQVDEGAARIIARTGAQELGLTVMAQGDRVLVVPQALRAVALAKPVPESVTRIDGPLTPLVRETAEAPALFSAYAVSGMDGALWRSMAFWMDLLPASKNEPLLAGDLGLLAKLYEGLAVDVDLGFAGAMMPLMYDMAGHLDLKGSIVEVELSGSEL